MTAPSIGRIVHYALTEADADAINEARAAHPHRKGNDARAGQVLPLLVVRVWPGDLINGQVFLDGNDTYWVTSRPEGDGRGTWAWPPRV